MPGTSYSLSKREGEECGKNDQKGKENAVIRRKGAWRRTKFKSGGKWSYKSHPKNQNNKGGGERKNIIRRKAT